jgi:hypothetical protein
MAARAKFKRLKMQAERREALDRILEDTSRLKLIFGDRSGARPRSRAPARAATWSILLRRDGFPVLEVHGIFGGFDRDS